MTDISRGHAAKTLLQNPLIEETLTEIEEKIQAEWIGCTDSNMREELWYTLKGLHRFKLVLNVAIEKGEYESIMTEKENGT